MFLMSYMLDNVIREALKTKLDSQPSHGPHVAESEAGLVTNREGIARLHEKAKGRCINVVHEVVKIIQQNLGSTFFQYDASLVRDGCFYAAFLLAGESGSNTDIEACVQALGEMRWVFSKSEERMHTVQMIWQARVQQSRGHARPASSSPAVDEQPSYSVDDLSYSARHPARALNIPSLSLTTGTGSRSQSAPNTGVHHDASWPTGISIENSTLHAQSHTATHRSSPSTSRTPPYIGSPEVPGVSRASTSKASLVASSSAVLLSSSTSGGLRTIQESPFYYGTYGYAPAGEASSHPPTSAIAGPSAGPMHLPPYSTAYHTEVGVHYPSSTAAQSSSMLPGASSAEEDDEGPFIQNRYY
jgi:hypothetical protein